MSATAPTTLSGTWVSDPVHSNASFAIKHMIVSTFRANFAQVEATVEIDGDDIRLTGKVPAESIDVEQADFRAHLLGRISLFYDYGWTPDPATAGMKPLSAMTPAGLGRSTQPLVPRIRPHLRRHRKRQNRTSAQLSVIIHQLRQSIEDTEAMAIVS